MDSRFGKRILQSKESRLIMIDDKVNPLWTERYRPHKVADCILPAALKKTFQQFVDDKNVPNLLLTGPAGIGKTTIARAMLDEIRADVLVINGSTDGRLIATLREDIKAFASTVSFHEGRKYIILDEADYMNAESLQPGLRNFMEEYSGNCGFILTCNFKNRILVPLQSRCSVIDFTLNNKEKVELAALFMDRLEKILDGESIPYEKSVLAALIKKYMPDWRRTLNEIQRYASHGKIDTGVLASVTETDIRDLLKSLKEKDFTAMRKWTGQNSSEDVSILFRRLYDSASEIMQPESIPNLVVLLGEYQYKAAFVADAEINLAACLTEVMHDCQFK